MTPIDQKVIALQQKVEEKKKKISQAERPVWKTNCVIVTDRATKNLQTINSISECVELYAGILAKGQAFDEAAKQLDVKESFSFGGFSLKQWQEDFKTRAAMISIVKEKQKLRDLELALESLESSELKQKKVLEGIEKALED
jgi:hypothetical protein